MKVKGTFSSVTKGVSQQAPADRLEGQHGEQVNMIADAVRGLVRRNGFIMENLKVSTFSGEAEDGLTDSFSYRVFPYRDGGRDYDSLYRSRARVGALSDAPSAAPALWTWSARPAMHSSTLSRRAASAP
jgi:hypothetical protein